MQWITRCCALRNYRHWTRRLAASERRLDRRVTAAGIDEEDTLLSSLESTASIGKPIVALRNRQGALANLANGFGWRPHVVTHNFVDRLAARAGIEEVRHCGSNGTSLSLGAFKRF